MSSKRCWYYRDGKHSVRGRFKVLTEEQLKEDADCCHEVTGSKLRKPEPTPEPVEPPETSDPPDAPPTDQPDVETDPATEAVE